MIRLAHLMLAASRRGTEQMVLQLCKFRDRSRFNTTVAMPEEGIMANEIRAAGATVYTHESGYDQAAREADLVNVHWWSWNPSLLAHAQQSGKPYITTLHWPVVLPPISAITVCTSRHTQKIQHFSSRFVTVLNGADLDRFHPAPHPPRDEIVITRVCDPSKCAPYFWDAMAIILRRYPHVRLQIVGNTPPEARSTSRVSFLGVRRDIPEILQQSDIFFYTPYRGYGSKDLVVMEASAVGLPCVVADTCAVQDSVWEGQNGFLTPFGDVDACVERLSQLIEDHELRSRMGRDAARLARMHFDAREMTRKYELVYNAVLAEAR